MSGAEPAVFALAAGRDLGERIAAALGRPLAQHEERDFEDGEHKARPLESVRRRDAYVIQSLHGDGRQSVNDRLCRLLFFCGTLRDLGAASVTVVAPYLCYARKDRRTKSRDPVTSRYVAELIEAMGVDAVVAMDVHNPAAFENAFRCRAEHLEARALLVRHLAAAAGGEPLAVVAPDAGGVKRADALRTALAEALGAPITSAYAEKARSGGVVTGDLFAGEVRGRVAVIVDDMISTGTTIVRTARRCREAGATGVIAVATHAVFAEGADEALADPALSAVVVTDTVAPRPLRGPAAARVTVLGTAPFLAEAIRRLHAGASLVELNACGPVSPGADRGRAPA
jgi:ribose-phosphate pyrophosphokinase